MKRKCLSGIKKKFKKILMKKSIQLLFIALTILMLSCESKVKTDTNQKILEVSDQPKNKALGNLFIIGGGKKSDALVAELIDLSKLKADKYMVILPMASEEPDSAVYYTAKQFIALGVNPNKIVSFNFNQKNQKKSAIDSLRNANLIYITGGDQNLFMQAVLDTDAFKAIHNAYQKGATIAGTSAGAAVMSKKMITGNELKYPKYTGDFRTIEAENFEIKEGLGLLSNVIIDQHFIKRMRMNRLLSVAIENPEETSIGIDESTAIVVHGDSAKVTGDAQVIIIKNSNNNNNNSNSNNIHHKNGLLGAKNIVLEILLPGEKFKL